MLSNFITLTHWKQLFNALDMLSHSCELLSNFITLTHWKQLTASIRSFSICCELLSNFITLTHWKQPASKNRVADKLWIAFKLYNFDTLKTTERRNILTCSSCELLSNFITLTHWKQQSLSNELWTNGLCAVFRIKIRWGNHRIFCLIVEISFSK